MRNDVANFSINNDTSVGFPKFKLKMIKIKMEINPLILKFTIQK